jgi:hypothetical protein
MPPILYLLSPTQDERPIFCPDCALLEGLLVYYPAIMDAVRVARIAFQRPRAALISELGEAHQRAPVLVWPEGEAGPKGVSRAANGRQFLDDPAAIAGYFADLGLAGRLPS